MEFSTRTRRTISTLLAVFLAVESVSAVAAAAATTTISHPLPAATPAGAVLAEEATVAPELTVAQRPVAASRFTAPAWSVGVVERAEAPAPVTVKTPEPAAAPVKAKPAKATKTPAKVTKSTTRATKATKTPAKVTRSPKSAPAKASTRSSTSAADFHGRNRVWIPALGINRSVQWFPCERQRPPDNVMYRWGCAGTGNIYLMGHASGVMHGLYDAYLSGRLHAGMKAYYAAADGKVHVYAVRWWKTTRPTTDAAWAWASQGVPSMTLQTCVGANSERRLMVRLVEIGG